MATLIAAVKQPAHQSKDDRDIELAKHRMLGSSEPALPPSSKSTPSTVSRNTEEKVSQSKETEDLSQTGVKQTESVPATEETSELTAIEDIMTFLQYPPVLKENSKFRGNVLFNFKLKDGSITSYTITIEDGKVSAGSNNNQRPEKIACEVSISVEDFIYLYSGKASVSWLTSSCYSGRVKVHGMAYRALSSFATSFDYSSDMWAKFYAAQEGAEVDSAQEELDNKSRAEVNLEEKKVESMNSQLDSGREVDDEGETLSSEADVQNEKEKFDPELIAKVIAALGARNKVDLEKVISSVNGQRVDSCSQRYASYLKCTCSVGQAPSIGHKSGIANPVIHHPSCPRSVGEGALLICKELELSKVPLAPVRAEPLNIVPQDAAQNAKTDGSTLVQASIEAPHMKQSRVSKPRDAKPEREQKEKNSAALSNMRLSAVAQHVGLAKISVAQAVSDIESVDEETSALTNNSENKPKLLTTPWDKKSPFDRIHPTIKDAMSLAGNPSPKTAAVYDSMGLSREKWGKGPFSKPESRRSSGSSLQTWTSARAIPSPSLLDPTELFQDNLSNEFDGLLRVTRGSQDVDGSSTRRFSGRRRSKTDSKRPFSPAQSSDMSGYVPGYALAFREMKLQTDNLVDLLREKTHKQGASDLSAMQPPVPWAWADGGSAAPLPVPSASPRHTVRPSGLTKVVTPKVIQQNVARDLGKGKQVLEHIFQAERLSRMDLSSETDLSVSPPSDGMIPLSAFHRRLSST